MFSKIFTKDLFLEKFIGKPCYSIAGDHDAPPEFFISGKESYVYVNIPAINVDRVALYENLGFHAVDLSLQLERTHPKPRMVKHSSDKKFSIRLANADDEEKIAKIAETAFTCSRFHLDSQIPNNIANSIKSAWVRNFFQGKRGTDMIVATHQGKTIGFTQLLGLKDKIVIDLIAVDADFRRKGIATAMIEEVETNLSDGNPIAVGTQACNVSSIRSYERLGFRITSSNYVMHYHGSLDIHSEK